MTFGLTLVFIMLVFLRPQEWLLPSLFGWPLLEVITYASLVALILETGRKSFNLPKTPAIKLAAGLFLSSVLSHVSHGYFKGVMDTIPVTFKICFFMVLLMTVIDSLQRLQGVIFMFLAGAVVMAIHAIMQEKTGAGFAGQAPLLYYYEFKDKAHWVQQSKFFGIFDDPNDLGQFLATCMPLVFALPRRLRVASFILAAACVWLLAEGMLATQSRGTLIGVVASVGCMVVLILPSRWLPTLGVLMAVGGLIACAIGGGALLDQSARDRVVMWGLANQYFKTHFLFGGGYGMFEDFTNSATAAHNAYVLCYSELGFFGYWFWFNTLLLGMIGCWRTRVAFRHPRTPDQAYLKRVAGLGIAAMAGFAASAYFLSRAYVFPLFFVFALLASIPVIAQRYLPHDHPPLVSFRKDVLGIGTVSSLFSVIYIYITIILLNRAYGA